MDDLILQFQTFGITNQTFITKQPYHQLLHAKNLATKALVSTIPSHELKDLYSEMERFNIYTKEHVSFNTETYSDNPVLQKIIKQCDEYYHLTFQGDFRTRILNCLLLYDNMLMCI